MAEERPDFVLIQEPWVNGGRICGLRTPGYNLYANGCVGKPRTCILANKKLNVFLLHSYSSNDTTVVSWETSKRKYRLASCYMPYDEVAVPSQLFKELVRDAEASKCSIILGCDSNAHHNLWGSTDINERGELLFNYLIGSKLLLCNKGSMPTFITRNRQEVLDITLVSEELVDKITHWRVLEEHSFSDHRYIECIIEENVVREEKFRNHRKTNWQMHMQELKKRIPMIPPFQPEKKEDLDILVKRFTDSCRQALEVACPLTHSRGRIRPPWWTPILKNMQKNCRRQFNSAKLSQEDIEWDNYHNHLRAYKKEVRKAKRNSWKSFCSDIEDTAEVSRLRKIMTQSKHSIGYLQKPDHSWTESSKETLGLLMDTHFPDSSENLTGGHIMGSEVSSETPPLDIVSDDNVYWAIGSFKPYKTPGPDGLFPAQLQQSLSYTINWITTMFRGALKLNYIPSTWREVKVIYIPKAGKSSHINPKDFRPISLSSFLLKTLERLIEIHIKDILNPRKMAVSQHAYSKGRSTETALSSVVAEIEKSLEIKEYTLVAFLDIEGAFNNIQPKAILSALKDLGISEPLRKLIEQMLLGRSIISTLGASTMYRSVRRGTPQGGVLSPLLWVLTMNKMLVDLEKKGIHVVAYADDVAVSVRGKFPNTLASLMQTILNEINRWAVSCGLNLNASKTELVLFTKKHSTPEITPPFLNGTRLTIGDKASYLGLILDRKLSWKQNLEARVKKAATALYTCKRMVGPRWGLTPRVAHWLYTAIVRPIMTYGIVVWWPITEKKYAIRSMESIQRAASICISGALRTTPSQALNIILHLLPTDLYCKQMAAKSALRLREASLLVACNKGHSRILRKFPVLPITTDFRNPVELNLNPVLNITFPSREEWERDVVDKEEGISFYTDGSKLDNRVGGGVFSAKLDTKIAFRLPDHCSVFQAEVTAIKESLLVLTKSVITTRSVFIYTDSQAALKSLMSHRISSKTVKDCHDLLADLSSYFTINLQWVPGHSDIPGNCVADELARAGTTLQLDPGKVDINMPLATCRYLIDKHVINIAECQWNQSLTCSTSRQTWQEWNMSRTCRLLKFKRNDIRTLVGVLTGHCLIGRHASRLGAPYNDYCRSCQEVEEEETIKHLLCDCAALYRKRIATIGRGFLDDVSEVAQIKLVSLMKFIRSTGWFREEPIE